MISHRTFKVEQLHHTHTHNFIHQSMADTKYRYKC